MLEYVLGLQSAESRYPVTFLLRYYVLRHMGIKHVYSKTINYITGTTGRRHQELPVTGIVVHQRVEEVNISKGIACHRCDYVLSMTAQTFSKTLLPATSTICFLFLGGV